MPVELRSAAGELTITDDGRMVFTRAGRVVLESNPTPAFVVQFSIEMPLVQGSMLGWQAGNGPLTVSYATEGGAFAATLSVVPEQWGFRLIWELPVTSSYPAIGVGWKLQPQGPWYGMGERFVQPWPLDALPIASDPFVPYDYAPDGSLDIATPLWYNACGAAILAFEESGELACTIRPEGFPGADGLLRIMARLPERTIGLDLGAPRAQTGASLVLGVLLADDVPGAHALAIGLLGHPAVTPPQEMIARPIWTTWAHYKMAVTQQDVLEFAQAIAAHDYPYSVLEIDDRWQAQYGDTEWDLAKFPEPGAMITSLHSLGFKVTLWVPPFFNPDSRAFAEAAERGYLVRHPAGGAPSLVRWWQGYGGLIDATNKEAMDWWRLKLGKLQSEYGVDSFKFDAGEANFVPHDRATREPLQARNYADLYAGWVADNFKWTEVRTGWRSQKQGILFREWDKGSRWGLDNGLHSVLTQALALSMIGYPFILPDMIGGNAYDNDIPDAELMVRWTQLTALLPAMQFSVPPWIFDEQTNAICLRYAQLHEEMGPYLEQLMAETVATGAPLIRPIFWHSPGDRQALTVDDEFLLGDRFLVAPVVKPGQNARDIYLPEGQWRDRASNQTFTGPTNLIQYPAPLDVLPLFERVRNEDTI